MFITLTLISIAFLAASILETNTRPILPASVTKATTSPLLSMLALVKLAPVALALISTSFVIASNSLAIHYAILLDKPIILITSSNIPHEPIKKYVKSWSEEINCDLINISDQSYILDLSFKNYNKNYKSLIKNYLNSNHDSKKNIISIWEDFINKYA